jgi:hypothetical protein
MVIRASGDAGWPVEWMQNVRNVGRILGKHGDWRRPGG